MHKKYLEYAGLSEKEAVVYLSLLEAGAISAMEIVKKTDLKKSIVYLILEDLVKKNFVREVVSGKRVKYEAGPTEVFRDIIKNKQSQLAEEAKRIETVISELNTIEKDLGEKPTVRFFEGKDGVKHSIEEYVSMKNYSEGKDYDVYSYDVMEKVFSENDIKNIDEKRINKNVRFKAIYSGAGKIIHGDKDKEPIKIDQERFPLLCDIGVFENDVRIHTLGKKPYGIHIKSKELATTLKSLMEYIFAIKV